MFFYDAPGVTAVAVDEVAVVTGPLAELSAVSANFIAPVSFCEVSSVTFVTGYKGRSHKLILFKIPKV